MSTWDEIKDSPAGTEFTDKDGERWRITETHVEPLSSRFSRMGRNGSWANNFFGDDYYGPYTVTKTPDTDTTLENKYLTAALVALGMDHTLTASTVQDIMETARKIEEATK